jgi:hypothetical protein
MCCIITSEIAEISERSKERNATFTKWKRKARNQQEVGYTCPQSWIILQRHRRYWDHQSNQQLAWHVTTHGERSEIIEHVFFLSENNKTCCLPSNFLKLTTDICITIYFSIVYPSKKKRDLGGNMWFFIKKRNKHPNSV